jgi:hypothetical protein
MSSKGPFARLNTSLGIQALLLLCLLAVVSSVCPEVIAQQEQRAPADKRNQPDFRIASGRGFVKMPFDTYWNGILLQVRINNSQPVWLAMDTGASLNIISQRLFKRLGLKAGGAANLTGGTGGFQSQFVQDATISLPGVEAYKQIIGSAPIDEMTALFGRDVEGLIGTPFIKNFVIEIDYAGRAITFYDPKVYSLRDSKEAINLENRNGLPFAEVELSLNGRDTIKDKFMLDTGSTRIFQINSPFARVHKILSIVPAANMTAAVGEAIGGQGEFTEARISSIRIGKYVIKRPVVSIYRGETGGDASADAGVIGSEIFRRFTVTLDYQSGKMLLKPNAHFKEPYEIDMSGLELMTRADDFKVILIKSVLANSPAAAAGLREGDQLIAINNKSAARFNLAQLTMMFKQAGKVYPLTIKRGDRTIRTKLRLRRAV